MSAEKDFWKWFVENEEELFKYRPIDELLFDKIAVQLRKVHADLTFEIGPPRDVQREFVISAGGVKSAFPHVTRLVAATPTLARWVITPFRPRRKVIGVVQIQGKRVDPEDVQFSLLDNGVIAGIHLFLPGFHEADKILKQIGYLLLDDALGEFDVESNLGFIKMLPIDAETDEDRYPLTELAAKFDQLNRQLRSQNNPQ
jgi:hypothetical protein